jgi:hypothetical protein
MVERTDSRLILWQAKNDEEGSFMIYEELAEPPIEKQDFLYIYPVKTELSLNGKGIYKFDLPKQLGVALSMHFRNWFGDLIKEGMSKRNSVLGTDEEVKKLRQKLLEAKYAHDAAEKDLAYSLFIKTRRKCKNCDNYVSLCIDEQTWQHESPADSCNAPA